MTVQPATYARPSRTVTGMAMPAIGSGVMAEDTTWPHATTVTMIRATHTTAVTRSRLARTAGPDTHSGAEPALMLGLYRARGTLSRTSSSRDGDRPGRP